MLFLEKKIVYAVHDKKKKKIKQNIEPEAR